MHENIDFTENLLNFAHNMEKHQIFRGLLPGLQMLAAGPPELQAVTL